MLDHFSVTQISRRTGLKGVVIKAILKQHDVNPVAWKIAPRSGRDYPLYDWERVQKAVELWREWKRKRAWLPTVWEHLGNVL